MNTATDGRTPDPLPRRAPKQGTPRARNSSAPKYKAELKDTPTDSTSQGSAVKPYAPCLGAGCKPLTNNRPNPHK